MNRYFIVSSDVRFHPESEDLELFTCNNHIHQKNRKTKLLSCNTFTKEEIEKNSDLATQKYTFYRASLGFELNELHNENLSSFFWTKSLGLSFKRYVSMLHLAFIEFSNFDPAVYKIKSILSEESYFIPKDFEEQRTFIQHTDLGREQLFSIYLNFFHPALYQQTPKLHILSNLLVSVRFFTRLKFRLKKTKESLFRERQIAVVGILDSFFSNKNRKNLTSEKGIMTLNINSSANVSFSKVSRESLGETLVASDSFDRFFRCSLEYFLPKFFVENFSYNKRFYLSELEQYPSLKYIVCEAWISSTRDAFILALAKEYQNVIHIYNEHNIFSHPFLGNNTKLIGSMVDVYYTLGWVSSSLDTNIQKGASLFFEEYCIKSNSNSRQILFIDVASFAYLEEFFTKYSESEFFVSSYFGFIKKFFSEIDERFTSQITYRDYPIGDRKWKCFDNKSILEEFFPANLVFDDKKLSGNEMMMQSSLNIIPYTNTAYIQSIVLNIPTIFFWNKEVAHLDNDHLDFFDDLIDVGVCQTDPKQAAEFLVSIESDIKGWWDSAETQKARERFLNKNMGPPERAFNFYTSLLGE